MDERHKKPGVAFWATLGIVLSLLLIAGYAGSYFLLVEPIQTSRYYPLLSVSWFAVPHYHVVGKQDFWRSFFAPANSVDRRIRPKTWSAK